MAQSGEESEDEEESGAVSGGLAVWLNCEAEDGERERHGEDIVELEGDEVELVDPGEEEYGGGCEGGDGEGPASEASEADGKEHHE